MSKGLVLISGVNGYIAAVVAKHFLESGYSVRGTVRRLSSAKPLLEDSLKDYASAGTFTVVEVPDITVEGGFDEAVKDVTAIAHLAAPVSFSFKDPEPVLHAAVNGTVTILTSALSSPSIKTFVMMSSIAAIIGGQTAPYKLTEKDWNTVAEKEVERLGKDTPGNFIYGASKTAAEKAFWKFRDEKKPNFTMTAINPVFVIGPPLIKPKTAEQVGETYRSIFTVFSGGPMPPAMGTNAIVDVRDIAKLTLYPIEHASETNGERYIAKSAKGHPQAYADILRKAFPERKDRITEGTPGEGYRTDYGDDPEGIVVDATKGSKLVGSWIGIEQSVVETAKSLEYLLDGTPSKV